MQIKFVQLIIFYPVLLILLIGNPCCFGKNISQKQLLDHRAAPEINKRRKNDEKLKEIHCIKKKIITDGINIALPIYKKMAVDGDDLAQYSLGMFYLKGYGVEQDFDQAVIWFYNAAKQGHVAAQYSLARCYQKGIGVKKNHRAAAKLFEQAANQGHRHSQQILGRYYQQGLGVEKNPELAEYWLNKSAENTK